ncbi:hypothetical protein [Streptomyces sp. NPDC058426]|uniref:hypothetical protein n=1 Tax=Streptomyces sp. NPDC058426 TaxID=3346493 RepID=UPI0036481BAA
MPGITVERATARPSEAPAAPVAIESLTTSERRVALYVSDMPGQRRYRSNEEYAGWVQQGVALLGVEELRRRAACLRGYEVLSGAGLASAEVRERHAVRYPKAGRLEWAARVAANLSTVFGLDADAAARNDSRATDGWCACDGTGLIALPPLPEGPDHLVCPVHDHRSALAADSRRLAGAKLVTA